jgi:hypothetical protein
MGWIALVVLLAGCDDDWWISAAIQQYYSTPTTVTVDVETTRGAVPELLFDDSLRASIDGDGTIVSADADRETERGKDWVRVLDAWDDCLPQEDCSRLFTFEIRCDGPCAGTISVDAFLATQGLPSPQRGGAIALSFVDP